MRLFSGTDRGVSDTIGFVFIFGLIISIVGLTFAVGYSGLQDTRDFERLNNAERAFDVMGDNFEDMVRRGAPSRATEVKVADAELVMADPTVVNVSLTNSTDVTDSFQYSLQPIVYETDEGRIVYVNGAIFREDRGGAVIVRHSETILREERVLIPVLATRSGGGPTVAGGTTTVLVRAGTPSGQQQSFGLEAARTDESTDVTMNVTSPRPEVWLDELDRHEDANCSIVGDTVTCTVDDAKQVYLQQSLIDIIFE